jgi:hypothetical protein
MKACMQVNNTVIDSAEAQVAGDSVSRSTEWAHAHTGTYLNFSLFYYSTGLYRLDYEEILGRVAPPVYHVEDTWPGYGKLKARIHARYREWSHLKSLLQDTTPPMNDAGAHRMAV